MKFSFKIVGLALLAALLILAGYYLLSFYWRKEPGVKEVAFARSIDPETAKPIEAATEFRPQEDVYLSFRTINSHQERPVRVEWYLIDPLRKISQDDRQVFGSRQIAFIAKAPPEGWPIGGYQAKIFIDHQEKAVQEFQIEE